MSAEFYMKINYKTLYIDFKNVLIFNNLYI